ncbi:hypothetical protein LV478_04600 [Komagataeibacter oboediens]|uniref:hypothetical protein n=1 Tax=Komagataeibacter oboediens TaxID=65958 RepID=UPI001904B6FB|nr:hypothetical protein [Komagataeibacter oboediens]WEQ52830.1 hypothetical protein LV478_04600 [Komagataeibacter oboediens]GCE80548.1 hypothetical protein MSKU3_2023 [Komagataeibacter oboediens]
MHDPHLPAGCTQTDIDARFEPEEPAWVASYVTQLRHRLDRLETIRMELAADCFDGAYDGADILGYLDDEMETVRMEIEHPQLTGGD